MNVKDLDPKLLVDAQGKTRVLVPKGTVVFFNATPAKLLHDTEMAVHVSNLWAWPVV